MNDLIRVKVLLPIEDNDGSDLMPLIEKFEEAVYLKFGGLSHYESYFRQSDGKWRMETGECKNDICREYVLAIKKSQLSAFKGIVTDFKSETTQEAIFVEIDEKIDIQFW
jgi:hypothetical protein